MTAPRRDGPPVGTVTCLFSDIEGSTRLEIDVGTAAYRDILERHQALLRTALEVGLVAFYESRGWRVRRVRQHAYKDSPAFLDAILTKRLAVVEPLRETA